jgi:N-acetylmuramoyl-L-alanine amidase
VAAGCVLAGGWPALATVPATAAAPARIERVRYLAAGGSTRVIVMLSRQVPYEVRILPGESARHSERRLVLDFSNARLAEGALRPIGVEDGIVMQIRTGQFTARTARVVLDLTSVTGHTIRELPDPPRIVIDVVGRTPAPGERDGARIARGGSPSPGGPERADPQRLAQAEPGRVAAPAPVPTPAPEGVKPSTGAPVGGPSPPVASIVPSPLPERLAARPPEVRAAPAPRATSAPGIAAAPERADRGAAGAAPGESDRMAGTAPPAASQPSPVPPRPRGQRWRIVLDPGHGGSDPGTRGVDGVLEKNVTLAIAKRLKQRLEEGLGADVLLTRSRDVGRSLAERTAFANANSADIFVSIHANADATGDLHGVETYTLNNSNDRGTVRLAKMENGPGVRTGRGDLSFILSDMVQSGKEEGSIALANHLHFALLSQLRARHPDVRNLGVKKGPFYVLVGAYMPCVLVETSFLSHPKEGRRLATTAYQAEIAEGLYRGMTAYLGDARLAKTL